MLLSGKEEDRKPSLFPLFTGSPSRQMRDTYLGEGIFFIESARQDVSSKRSQKLIQPESLGSARNLETLWNAVFICSGYHNNIPLIGWLRQQKFIFFPVLGARSLQLGWQHGLILVRALLLYCIWNHLTVSSQSRERERGSSLVSQLIRALIPSCRTHTHNFI